MQFYSLIALVVLGGLVMSGLGAWINNRHKERMERLSLLAKALDRQDLDATTRRDLLSVLRDDHGAGFLARPDWWSRVAFGAGWVTLLISGGMALLHYLGVVWTGYEVTLPLCLVAIAVMTVPSALAELVRRQRAAASSR